eukprot:CAMPEP_0174835100 /NCGR_PEP_ID=MMETSP1114-20130205/5234_1 /TAXON_ID=312471 /ORGANISM="Neobodo designis, Strain CCAP 1951/1" /LENGTH=243 /DNA_ID=CAMNT_0016069045 /DNA_START=77 /DNA_END=808 /DNA_ORIENTATION=+
MIDSSGSVGLPTRVSWFDYRVHPAKRFIFWAVRHLQKLPEDWRPYYDKLLRNEIRATRDLNTSWDVFIAVAEGYRKAKWVLKKYGKEPEPGSIPHPYDDFWKNTTHEERVWAHRRSHQLKELQAVQREEQDLFGAVMQDRNNVHMDQMCKLTTSKQHSGNQVHAMDLPAPRESEIRDDEELTHIMMASVEDDRMWNPAVRSRDFRDSLAHTEGLMAFEDAEDDEDDDDDDDEDDDRVSGGVVK